MRTKEEVAAGIDHAVLKRQFTDADVIAACEIGRRYHTATVCVRPTDTPRIIFLTKPVGLSILNYQSKSLGGKNENLCM